MTQHEFDILLEKYLEGRCMPDEAALVEQWHARVTEQPKPLLTGAEQEVTAAELWQKIKHNTLPKKNFGKVFFTYLCAVAASLALVLWVGGQYILKHDGGDTAGKTLPKTDLEIRNTSGKIQKINLPDGSEVTLDPASTLSYPDSFGQLARHVYLIGKGFFKVVKDAQRPFMVHTGNLTTEAIGTSFSVNAPTGNAPIEVVVITGKVAVYDGSKKETVRQHKAILTRNQTVIYHTETQQLETGIAKNAQVIKSEEPGKPVIIDLTFEDVLLPEVLAQLKKAYGLDFILANEALKNCQITADLNALPLFTQIELICQSVGARYRAEGTHILIEGKGCNHF